MGKARQPQPFNDYSDSAPYGTELEEERDATAETQSYPAAYGFNVFSFGNGSASSGTFASTQQAPQRSSASERVETLEQPAQTAPKRMVTSKAEMLQQQENLPQE